MFTDSAAGIVLDVNKQVVFARTSKGEFLARQVLAINDAGQLACYEVYPSVDRATQEAFIAYDRAFARALGVSIAVPHEEDDDPKVATLLASYWYDDGAWDLEVVEP